MKRSSAPENMRCSVLLAITTGALVRATELLDRNLAYSSPFKGYDVVCGILWHRAAYRDEHVLVFS